MTNMFRRPMASIRQAALLMALAVGARGSPYSDDVMDVTSNVPRPKPKRKQGRSKIRHRGTFHVDRQHAASLRRRMGGNAVRIRMARNGLVFNDNQVENPYEQWVPSPTVLPEEVEHYRKLCLNTNPLWRWQKPNTSIRTKIRGHIVDVWPLILGPVRYEVVS